VNIAALIAALLFALGLGPPVTTIDTPAASLDRAVRLSQYPVVHLPPGEVTDVSGLGVLALLHDLYSPAEMAAGGEVLIRTADTGIYAAWVKWNGLCGNDAPICIEVNPTFWATTQTNRAVMAHEWAHVITNRYQQQIAGAQATRFNQPLDLVNQECMADSLAAIVLARGGFPPSLGRYQCDVYWTGQGHDPVEMERLSGALAQTVIAWAAHS
jgi:hypothetical protein